MSTPTEPPESCTCTWTATGLFGSVYIADDDCPARPHPRSWRKDPPKRPRRPYVDDLPPPDRDAVVWGP